MTLNEHEEKWFQSLMEISSEEIIERLSKAGYDVVAIPEKEQRIRNLEAERKVIVEEYHKLGKRSDEITKEIQSLCEHAWTEEEHSDGWDGYSRVTLDVRITKRCTKCGLRHERKTTRSY